MSDALCEFLLAIDVVDNVTGAAPQTPLLRRCVIALARLPLYSFDEEHPFEKVRFVVKASENTRQELNSNIYGSLMRRWSQSTISSIGNVRMGYEGDGTTRSFAINVPVNLRIQHWS
jgi:hypothetical protein